MDSNNTSTYMGSTHQSSPKKSMDMPDEVYSEMKSGSQMMSGDQMMSEGRMMSGDKMMSGDRMMSGDKMMSGDRMMSGDKTMSGDRMMSGDKTMSGDRMMSGDQMTMIDYPNRWSRYRSFLREPFAEFLGVVIFIIIGAGVGCQVGLSANSKVTPTHRGEYLSINIGWAAGLALGVWVSGGISGGHLNPAVTLAFATFRGFPWKKVPVYIFAQLMGGIVGAAVVYANYFHAIDIVEGRGVRTLATAGLFATYPLGYLTNVSAFFSEFMATAVLLIVIFAMVDKRNGAPPPGLAPLVLFMVILGISSALGMQTGFCLNPARDLGPRILTAMAGYGKDVFTFRSHYWIWCPVIGPILGALFGAFVYDTLVYTGEDSLLNQSGGHIWQRFLQKHSAQGKMKADEAV